MKPGRCTNPSHRGGMQPAPPIPRQNRSGMESMHEGRKCNLRMSKCSSLFVCLPCFNRRAKNYVYLCHLEKTKILFSEAPTNNAENHELSSGVESRASISVMIPRPTPELVQDKQGSVPIKKEPTFCLHFLSSARWLMKVQKPQCRAAPRWKRTLVPSKHQHTHSWTNEASAPIELRSRDPFCLV